MAPEPDSSTPTPEADATASQHTCSKCGRGFGHPGSLARHFNACGNSKGPPPATKPPSAPSAPSAAPAAATASTKKRRRSKADRELEEKLLAEPDVFVVECLLAERYHGSGPRRRKQYLVAWEGYGRDEDTWEDADSILDVRCPRACLSLARAWTCTRESSVCSHMCTPVLWSPRMT